jgi:hypothetical protein
VKVFVIWHEESQIESLKFKGGSQRQNSHKDSITMSKKGKRKQMLKHKAFSALLSIEEGTAWINAKGNQLQIEKGSLLIWRADYRHAGAAYQKDNQRIFFSISHSIHVRADRNKVAEVQVRKVHVKVNN